MRDLYPLCRSLTGPGNRATLDRIAHELPLERHRVATGSTLFDWTVPDEWRIDGASVRDSDGAPVISFADSNLHVMGYSAPIQATMSFDELRPHLHSLPDRPAAIPYRTTYYNRTFGFCAAHETVDAMASGAHGSSFSVHVDADLAPGNLDFADVVIGPPTADIVVLSTHICHPSMANDNLTGIAAMVSIGQHLLARTGLRYQYRLVFSPGTLGSLAWLHANQASLGRVAHGMVITGLGDTSPFTFKRPRRQNTELSRIAEAVLRDHADSRTVPFTPYGYDERQFCAPGFDLPVGRLTRGVHNEYAEYHTSADDLSFVGDDELTESVELLLTLIDAIEVNRRYRNLAPYGEPQLGRRGLYAKVGAAITSKSVEMGYLWVLSGADGTNDLVDIALQSGLPVGDVAAAADRLLAADLLTPSDDEEPSNLATSSPQHEQEIHGA
jgi:aminopeptidase-like protein